MRVAAWGSAMHCSSSRRVPVWGCPPVSRLARSRRRVSVSVRYPPVGMQPWGQGMDAATPHSRQIIGRWGWTVQLPVAPRVRVSAGQAPSDVRASRSRPWTRTSRSRSGGGGVDVLGAGVPTQPLARQVRQGGVQLLELRERPDPVPGRHRGQVRACRTSAWCAGRSRSSAAGPAGGWSAGARAACHQPIVDDTPDTATSGTGSVRSSGERGLPVLPKPFGLHGHGWSGGWVERLGARRTGADALIW